MRVLPARARVAAVAAMSEYDNEAFVLICMLRGGVPKKCDFCDQPFVEGKRYPIPEEAGEWACSECYARWEEEAKQ